MGAFVAADVTYVVTKQSKMDDGRKMVNLTLTFGDGAKTYPAGGIPLSIGKMACPTVINSLAVIDTGGSGYSFSYDIANKKLRMFQGAGVGAHTHDLLLKNAAVADGATTRINAGANLLGANTGGDLTITGGGANGGVVANAAGTAAANPELGTSVAPAAQTLKINVIGY